MTCPFCGKTMIEVFSGGEHYFVCPDSECGHTENCYYERESERED